MTRDDPVEIMAGEGNGGPVQSVGSDEPYRPQSSPELLRLLPNLKEYFEYMDWSEKKHVLSEATRVETERRCAVSEAKVESLTAEVSVQRDQVMQLHGGNAAYRHTVNMNLNKKLTDADERLAKIAEREEQLKVAEVRRTQTRRSDEPSADRDLFDAIEEFGTVIEKAQREMANLVAGKNRPQQAFDRWTAKFCEPSIQLVKLKERVQSTGEKNRKDIRERTADLIQREEALTQCTKQFDLDFSRRDRVREDQIKQRETERDQQQAASKNDHQIAMAQLVADRKAFSDERSEWRKQQTERLCGAELEAVHNIWLKKQEEEIKPQLRVQIERESENRHDESRAQAKEDGRSAGFEDGYDKGRAAGIQEMEPRMAEAKSESYNQGLKSGGDTRYREGYEKGAREGENAGLVRGVANGRQEEKTNTEKRSIDAWFRGVRIGATMHTWKHEQLFNFDGTANERHAYWWGRKLAHYIKTNDLLANMSSPWYGAGNMNIQLPLDLRRSERVMGDFVNEMYHRGIRDGLFVVANSMALPNWCPTTNIINIDH